MTGLHRKLGYDRITPQVLSEILEIARLVTVVFGAVSLLDTPGEGRTNTNTNKQTNTRHCPYELVVTVSILLTVNAFCY
jgi:hypothetical protein